MKKIKKALMGVTALLMAFSMTAICACSNSNKNDQNNENTDNTHQDDNQQDGGDKNDPTPAAKSEEDKVLEAIATQSIKGLDIAINSETKIKSTSYACDENGVKASGATESVQWTKNVEETSEKITLSPYEFDMISKSTGYILNKDGSAVDDTKDPHIYNTYNFMRGGKMFSADDDENIEISKLTLSYDSSFEMPAAVTGILQDIPEDGIPAKLASPVSGIINLGKEYDGVSFADKKLTVNLNKVAYGAYNDVLQVIEGLDEDTTVGEIIDAKPVKVLIQSLTYGLKATDVHDKVVTILTEKLAPEGATEAQKKALADILKVITAPAAEDDVYTYIKNNLQSKEFTGMLISQLTGEPVSSMIAPLSEFKIMEVVELVSGILGGGSGNGDIQQGDSQQSGSQQSSGAQTLADTGTTEEEAPTMTMEQVKAMISQYLDAVTVTEDKITITDPDSPTELSAMSIVYSVGDDYKVTSVALNTSMVTQSSYIDNRAPGEYNKTDSLISGTSSVVIDLFSDVTLVDISENKVATQKRVYNDGVYYSNNSLGYVTVLPSDIETNPDAKEEHYGIYAGVEVKNGVMGKVKFYTCDDAETYTEIPDCVENDGSVVLNYNVGSDKVIEGYVYTVELIPNEYTPWLMIDLATQGNVITDISKYDCQLDNDNLQIYIETKLVTETSTVAEILAADAK